MNHVGVVGPGSRHTVVMQYHLYHEPINKDACKRTPGNISNFIKRRSQNLKVEKDHRADCTMPVNIINDMCMCMCIIISCCSLAIVL